MENLNKIIGENLRRERIASGVTQKEIAEKVGYRNVDYFHTKFKKYVD